MRSWSPNDPPGRPELAFEKKMFLPIVVFDGDVGDLAKNYGLSAMPLTLAVNAKGEIVDSQVGAASKERFEAMINTALED